MDQYVLWMYAAIYTNTYHAIDYFKARLTRITGQYNYTASINTADTARFLCEQEIVSLDAMNQALGNGHFMGKLNAGSIVKVFIEYGTSIHAIDIKKYMCDARASTILYLAKELPFKFTLSSEAFYTLLTKKCSNVQKVAMLCTVFTDYLEAFLCISTKKTRVFWAKHYAPIVQMYAQIQFMHT